MSRYTFVDTLNEIESRVRGATPAPGTGPQAQGASAPLRGLAGDLRKLAEAHQPLTYEELYAVRSGAFELPEAPHEPSGEGAGAPLRKLAYDLRLADRALAEEKVAQANDLLLAASGLTLLRDRRRSTP